MSSLGVLQTLCVNDLEVSSTAVLGAARRSFWSTTLQPSLRREELSTQPNQMASCGVQLHPGDGVQWRHISSAIITQWDIIDVP
jgi:hypothetical protein